MLNKRKEGEFFAIIAAVLWGLNYPFIKMVLGYMPVGQFAAKRGGVGCHLYQRPLAYLILCISILSASYIYKQDIFNV